MRRKEQKEEEADKRRRKRTKEGMKEWIDHDRKRKKKGRTKKGKEEGSKTGKTMTAEMVDFHEWIRLIPSLLPRSTLSISRPVNDLRSSFLSSLLPSSSLCTQQVWVFLPEWRFACCVQCGPTLEWAGWAPHRSCSYAGIDILQTRQREPQLWERNR